MKKCIHCHIDINTDRITCPLCREILQKDDALSPNVYQPFPPFKQEKKKRSFGMRLSILISIITSVIVIVLNYNTFQEGDKSLWSLIILTAIFYGWSLVRGIIISKANLGHRLFWFGITLIILFSAIEYFNYFTPNFKSRHLTMTYAAPFIFISLVVILDFACLLKKVRYKDYIGFMFFFCLLCFIPQILAWFNVLPPRWPKTTASIFGIGNILAMFLLAYDATKEELKKRFYV